MNKKPIVIASLLSTILGFSPEVMAGPAPGRFRGEVLRSHALAIVRSLAWMGVVNAENPGNPAASFSTHVSCNSSKGNTEYLNYDLRVRPDSMVAVNIRGKVRLENKTVEFEASGVGPGTYTATSFATTIEKGNLTGAGDAKIIVFAGSSSPNKIKVDISVQPLKKRNPLRALYRALHRGKRQV